jgi:uncharacterized lipoprotein YddW (UPF0748 family)
MAKAINTRRRRALKTGLQGLGLSGLLTGCGSLSKVLDDEIKLDPDSHTESPQRLGGKKPTSAKEQGSAITNHGQAPEKNPRITTESPAHAQRQDESSSINILSLLKLPTIEREFRAAWVASVANIDWPSKPGLSSASLRAEIDRICTQAAFIGLNALIVQIRPSADALYASAIEPTSEFLVGQQGAALADGFDPLSYWIQSCKQHGLEFHAWFNPYRARHASAKSGFHAKHLAKQQPKLVVKYGDQWWMNPAEPKALEWSLHVIDDVVSRYDIDGVHLDDYFYPYPIQAKDKKQSALDFPDETQYKRYRQLGGRLDKPDWRRSHVDTMVQKLYQRVHKQKPWVRVGISPFGIGKPALRPAGIQGFSQYDQLFADVERWCSEAWLDYLAPQLYWKIEQQSQSFEVLLNYWSERLGSKRHLWPGLYTSSIGQAGRMWTSSEILDQIQRQGRQPLATGHIHFSMVALLNNRDQIATLLHKGPYQRPSLVPSSPWLSKGRPERPQLIAPDQRGLLSWERPLGSQPWGTTATRWVLHHRANEQSPWSMTHGDVNLNPIILKAKEHYVLRLLNRVGEASDAIAFTWQI